MHNRHGGICTNSCFDTLDDARDHAQVLVEEGSEGRIEKRHEWRSLVYGRKWHVDFDDQMPSEIIEYFPKTSIEF